MEFKPLKYEPLKSILDLTDNKQDSIVFFLKDEIKSKMNNYYLYEEKNNDIFLNQLIICIKRCDLSLDIKGRIISIKNNHDNKCFLCRSQILNKSSLFFS